MFACADYAASTRGVLLRRRYSLRRFGAPAFGTDFDCGGGGAGGSSIALPASCRPRLNACIPLPIDAPISGMRLVPNIKVTTAIRMRICQMLRSANTEAPGGDVRQTREMRSTSQSIAVGDGPFPRRPTPRHNLQQFGACTASHQSLHERASRAPRPELLRRPRS